MARKSKKSKEDTIIRDFVVIPLLILVGVAAVGMFVEQAFNVPQAAVLLFGAIGGITFVAAYYNQMLERHGYPNIRPSVTGSSEILASEPQEERKAKRLSQAKGMRVVLRFTDHGRFLLSRYHGQ